MAKFKRALAQAQGSLATATAGLATAAGFAGGDTVVLWPAARNAHGAGEHGASAGQGQGEGEAEQTVFGVHVAKVGHLGVSSLAPAFKGKDHPKARARPPAPRPGRQE